MGLQRAKGREEVERNEAYSDLKESARSDVVLKTNGKNGILGNDAIVVNLYILYRAIISAQYFGCTECTSDAHGTWLDSKGSTKPIYPPMHIKFSYIQAYIHLICCSAMHTEKKKLI